MKTVQNLRLLGLAAVLVLLLAACVPGHGPQLRNINNQTWGSNFHVTVEPLGVGRMSLPLRLELHFSQRFNQIEADASLAYDFAIFRINTGDLNMSGRLGLDDSLTLSNSDGLLQLDGRFVGDQLIGTVSVGGLVPVGDVRFTRVR